MNKDLGPQQELVEKAKGAAPSIVQCYLELSLHKLATASAEIQQTIASKFCIQVLQLHE